MAKKHKGHVPLKILEKRLAKLARVVQSRGGHAANRFSGIGPKKRKKSKRKGGARKK